METKRKTMNERARDFEDGAWAAYWDLVDLSRKLLALEESGQGIECDGTFDGRMTNGGHSLAQCRWAVREAAESVNRARRALAAVIY